MDYQQTDANAINARQCSEALLDHQWYNRIEQSQLPQTMSGTGNGRERSLRESWNIGDF
jgi:hypothetical protein